MKVTVTGIEKAKAKLKKALTLEPTIKRVLIAKTAERLRREAYRRTPVATGRLRSAGKVTVHGDEISYVNPTPYTWYNELGTGRAGKSTWEDFFGRSRLEDYYRLPFTPKFADYWPGMKATPFIRPAIVTAMDALVGTLRKIVKEEME